MRKSGRRDPRIHLTLLLSEGRQLVGTDSDLANVRTHWHHLLHIAVIMTIKTDAGRRRE